MIIKHGEGQILNIIKSDDDVKEVEGKVKKEVTDQVKTQLKKDKSADKSEN